MFDAHSRILFIVNPKAGTGKQDPDTFLRVGIGNQVKWDLLLTQSAGHATQLAENGMQDGYDAIVAVGGDGTLNEVGCALVGKKVPMGVIPAGSGNAFARALGISLDRHVACRQLLAGGSRSIDVGRVGNETFLSTAGAGLDAEVCRRFHLDPGGRGMFPYIKHTIAGVWGFEATRMLMYLEESEDAVEVWPTLLTVANTSAFGYGATIAPGASPEDGVLDVCVVEGMTALRALKNAHRLFNGTFDQTPGVTRFLARHLRVDRAAAGPIQVDGEASEGDARLDFSVVAGGLKVIVPTS